MHEKFTVGLIRVLTTDDPDLLNAHGRFIESRFPSLHVENLCIPDHPQGIHSPELARQAVPRILETARRFHAPDMLIVSCSDDPGLDELRAEFPHIPVTGGGEATAAVALRYGSRIGLLGITDYAPKAYLRLVPDRIVAVGRPEGVHTTRDLMTPQGRASTIAMALKLKEQGADVIALACTGMNTIGIAGELEDVIGLPVVDPVLAEGLFAYYEAVRR